MEKSFHAKIQYFADRLKNEAERYENNLLIGHTADEEKLYMLKSTIYREVAKEFEDLFSDVIFFG